MARARRGFTILELMVVMGIIAILATIVTVSATGAIKSARAKRRDTMKLVLQGGIDSYLTANGKWPDALEAQAKKGEDATLSSGDADKVFQQVVKESMKKSSVRYLDPSVLFVAPNGQADGKNYGLNFSDAIKRNPPKPFRHLNVSSMAFGYQQPSNGKFRRFGIHYNAATEAVAVTCE